MNILLADLKKRLVIVTGLAGSGKTTVVHALEDLGYTCVDNLPFVLLDSFISALESRALNYQSIALALDSRDPNLEHALAKLSEGLNQSEYNTKILFLESNDDVLIKRFSETRRMHPLSHENDKPPLSLREAIEKDRKVLLPFRDKANQILDTSNMSNPYLRNLIKSQYRVVSSKSDLEIQLISFGFKYGVPADIDTIFDARCFSNPHYVDVLRPLTGLDKRVKEYVFADENVDAFVEKISDFLNSFYPLYVREGKSYFAVGIGCTGGKHRSVAIVESLASELRKTIKAVRVEHRHFDKE